MKQDELKSAVGKKAAEYIEPYLNRDMVIGVGTGSTANSFIEALAELRHKFSGAIASSEATTNQLESHGIAVYDLNDINEMPYYVDGADESNSKLELVKGGGGALTREKILASVAKEFICIVDESKQVDVLGKFPLPVEVIPMARSVVSKKIADLGGHPIYRQDFFTDNGNIIIDVHGLRVTKPCILEDKMNAITGIVTTGLFAKRPADLLLVARTTGEIDEFSH